MVAELTTKLIIEQGDVFWLNFSPAQGSEPKGLRPAVILQSDAFNRSRINTVIVAAVTSNLKYELMPGNVRLARGESGLPKACVINLSQIKTIDRSYLGGKIGKLSQSKIIAVLAGIKIVFDLS